MRAALAALALTLVAGCATGQGAGAGKRGATAHAKKPASATPTPAPVAKTAAPPAGPEPVAVRRWGELAQVLASALRTGGASCPSVARTLDTFVGAHGAELASTYKALVTWEQSASRVAIANYYHKVFPNLEVRIDAGIRCKDDASAVAAFDRFFRAAGLDVR